MSDPRRFDLHDDDVLLAELRSALGHADPVPPEATRVALAAVELGGLTDELATLVADSLLDAGPRVRHDAPVTRQLSFTTAQLSLEIELGADGRTVIGAVSPAAVVEVETEGAAGAVGTHSDELGRFRLTLGQGWCRLRIRAAGASLVTPVIVR
jgi:hypothetical protein